ncbi:MAG: queuosine precursor transporter [bacterium]|nr:queuosine precursor transporter [bacterium]
MPILLIGLYIACELIANVTASKPVAIGNIVVPGAVFIYALTFTLIDLINEKLGKKGAQQVVCTAFAANILLVVYIHFVIGLPAASFYTDNDAFSVVLGSTPRIVFASLTAYLISSLVDTEVFVWWRRKVGKYKWARVLISNAVSTLIDSILFISIAFYGILPIIPLIEGQYIVKMAVTIISIPLIYLIQERKQLTQHFPPI